MKGWSWDIPLLIFVGLAVLGWLGRNHALAIAALLLIVIRFLSNHMLFNLIERYGVDLAITLLIVAVMAPLASGKVSVQAISALFRRPTLLLAVMVGALTSLIASRGVGLMKAEPLVVFGLLIGSILGVAFFRGVPVGPLIAAGLLALLIAFLQMVGLMR